MKEFHVKNYCKSFEGRRREGEKRERRKKKQEVRKV